MKTRNWIALVAGTLLALGVSYAAYTLANHSWNQVVDYRSPYAKEKLAETPSPPPSELKSKRVVYVIVDGMRDDVSRKMPRLETLRRAGYDAVVRTGQPALSFPNWTTLLSGCTQVYSGVLTNWFEGRVPVETVIDTALREDRTVAVSAPTDFEQLYGVKRTGHAFLRDWTEGSYMSGEIVDNAIRLYRETSPTLLVVHLPDIDEAGHASGGASKAYLDMALKVDADLGRLVGATQDGDTTFVIASDHGHIDTGGHGGWESVVVNVPVVFAGPDIRLGKGTGTQDQVAPEVAYLAGIPVPRNTVATPLLATFTTMGMDELPAARLAALEAYEKVVARGLPSTTTFPKAPANDVEARKQLDQLTADRAARERSERLPIALAVVAGALIVLAVIGAMSWRALVSSLAGTLVYYLVYDGLFFLAHGYRWSLSAFNSESLLKAFFNGRMVEAVIAALIGVAAAADIYLFMREHPRRPLGEYLPGWLAFGVATALTIQATLALQVAWYLWRYGVPVTWSLPDFMWAFKYDLDLIQATAVGAAAVLGPVVAYLVGRYHPLRKAAPAAGGTDAGVTASLTEGA